MASKPVFIARCLLGLFVISLVLQVCGTFSPYWIKDKNGTSECFRGIFFNKDCPDGMEGRRNVFYIMTRFSE